MRNKKRVVGNIFWWVAVIICVVVFLCGGLYFFLHYKEESETREIYNYVSELREGVLADPTYPTYEVGTNIEAIVRPGVVEKTYLPECKQLYEMNNDLVGWVSVPGTDVNYPVMQTDVSNRNYYLRRDFNKNRNTHGCIYAAEDCNIFKPSDNITLYGHHMSNGTMFASLDRYKEQAFWKEHKYFTFDTLYEHHTYQIFAVFKVHASSNFRYHMYTDFTGEAEFNEFISTVKGLQFYETGISAEYGDKLVCLSTCEYTLGDGRFVVVGKQIS